MIGLVEVVWSEPIGSSLFEDATAGDTTIYLTSVKDFSAGGGILVIEGSTYTYSNKTSTVSPTGERTDSLDISPALLADAITNTSVLVEPDGESKRALVRPVDSVSTDAVEARIPHALSAFFAKSGIRAPEDREQVEVEQQGVEWVLVDILGKAPVLDSDAAPPPSDGLPPNTSPAVSVSPGYSMLYLRWDPVENADPVSYLVYVDTVTPVASTTPNLVGEVSSTFTIVAEDGPGNPLVAGTDYYVMVVAKDADGAGPNGATVGPFQVVQPVSAEEWQQHEDAIGQLNNDLQQAETDIKDRTRVVYQDEQPTGLGVDDRVIWFDTNDGNAASYWDGSTWSQYLVGSGAIAANAVTAEKIFAGSVSTDELAAGAVTTEKMVAGSINGNRITGNTLDAGKIVSNSITAEQIAARTITADLIAAGTITATELAANVLSAGFVLAGQIKVGEATWTPENGLIIPQANGGSIHLPSDGVTPATITGQLDASSLTVQDNLTIQGSENAVLGSLELANGITRPKVAPSLRATWTSAFGTLNNGVVIWGDYYRGACSHHSDPDLFVTARGLFGTGAIEVINKNTGVTSATFTSDDRAWLSEYLLTGGIAYSGGFYYALGTYQVDPGGPWYLIKIDTNFNRLVHEPLSGYSAEHALNHQIALTADSSTNQLYVAHYSSDGWGRVQIYDGPTLNQIGGTQFNYFGSPVNIHGLYVGTADGFAEKTMLVNVADQRYVYAWRVSDWVRVVAREFPVAENANMLGLYFDSEDNRFRDIDSTGTVHKYGPNSASINVSASYTWYDAEGIVRETEPSPASSLTVPPRAMLRVQTDTPPDSGNTDPLKVDKANQVGIYVDAGVGQRLLQGRPGVDANGVAIRELVIEVFATNTDPEPTTNTFIGGGTSPGVLKTAAGGFSLSGDGSGAWPALRPAGEITMFGGAIAPAGWMFCQGQSLLRADYPALFAAIGTAYGAVDSSHFSLPDLQGSFPLGAHLAGVGGPGVKGGESQHTLTINEMPNHKHGSAGMVVTGNVPGTVYSPVAQGSSFGFAYYPAGQEPSAGGGLPHNNMPPYITMNFIIKT